MNWSFACISILLKSKLPKNCFINYLNEVSSQSLRSYFRLANIYDDASKKRKSDLIEMIIYGCMNGNLRNKTIDDISNNKADTILGLRKRDLKPYEENEKFSIKLRDWYVTFLNK